MSKDIVSYELRDGVAVLGMDDGKANALSHELVDQLVAALDRAEAEAKSVLMVGRAGKFCAGFDLRTMMSGVDAARELVRHGAEMYLKIFELTLPVVMACTGHAVAGGAVTTINPTYGPSEVRFQLEDARASILVTVPMFLETALAAAEGTDVTEVVVMGAGEGATPMRELFAAPIEQVAVDFAESTVVLPYSSGTTGLPKGVLTLSIRCGLVQKSLGRRCVARRRWSARSSQALNMNSLLSVTGWSRARPRFVS